MSNLRKVWISSSVGWTLAFGAVVRYAERLHEMDQVLIDSERDEATAQVFSKADGAVGNFSQSL